MMLKTITAIYKYKKVTSIVKAEEKLKRGKRTKLTNLHTKLRAGIERSVYQYIVVFHRSVQYICERAMGHEYKI